MGSLSPPLTGRSWSSDHLRTGARRRKADLCPKEDFVWYDEGVGYPQPGVIGNISKEQHSVSVEPCVSKDQCQNKANVAIFDAKRLQKRLISEYDIDDLVQLSEHSDAAVLWALKSRFEKDIFYTNVGDHVVFVNPYETSVSLVPSETYRSATPHIFALGNKCYKKLATGQQVAQAVVFSGVSGSGKTDASNQLLQYLAKTSPSLPTALKERSKAVKLGLMSEKVAVAVTVFESFGNAKTALNDNSSRVAKYTELLYKQGCMVGAHVTECALEKARIVAQNDGERNFHIFYELLQGLRPDLKAKFGLTEASKYFYVCQGGCLEISGRNDQDRFLFVENAMDVIGLTPDQQHTIWRTLAAVLHLGNIYFHKLPLSTNQEGVQVANVAEVKWVAYLLQLDAEKLEQLLTVRSVETKDGKIVVPLNIDRALDVRDAIAKLLYSSLFGWLMARVNAMTSNPGKEATIGILDMFGFELKHNSFENFLVNLASERLQSFFVNVVFKQEQEEYHREKIQWIDDIGKRLDNQPVIDLIIKRPLGILQILDDETCFPRGSDESFLVKNHYNHLDNPLYSKPRMNHPEFCIRHYTGQVWYQVPGMVEKNRDAIPVGVSELLRECQNHVVSQFLSQKNVGLDESAKFPRATVASKFTESLELLLAKLKWYFVRCVRANNAKSPKVFEMSTVLEQVQQLGIAETMKIIKLGFPVKISFKDFAASYRCLLQSEEARNGVEPNDVCLKILSAQSSQVEDAYRVGETKVFLRERLSNILELLKQQASGAAAEKIQKCFRGFLVRRKFQATRTATVQLQAGFRGWRARQDYRIRKQKLRDEAMDAKSVTALATASFNGAGRSVQHMDISAELDNFKRASVEDDCHSGEVVRLTGEATECNRKYPTPHNLSQHSFAKFAQTHFKGHIWQMRREPITTPFLVKESENDFHESLKIFKLILGFMLDHSLSKKQHLLLGNYVVQKGLESDQSVRDEVFCQVVNQTCSNQNPIHAERAWSLLAACASCFQPSTSLYKALLNYVSTSPQPDGLKQLIQKKLQAALHTDGNQRRKLPLTQLEWAAIQQKSNMALNASLPNGVQMNCQVESWTTASEFASLCLYSNSIRNVHGWTAVIHGPGVDYNLSGHDYVLDAIAHLESPWSKCSAKYEPCLLTKGRRPAANHQKQSYVVDEKCFTNSILNRRYNKDQDTLGRNGQQNKEFQPEMTTLSPATNSQQISKAAPGPGTANNVSCSQPVKTAETAKPQAVPISHRTNFVDAASRNSPSSALVVVDRCTKGSAPTGSEFDPRRLDKATPMAASLLERKHDVNERLSQSVPRHASFPALSSSRVQIDEPLYKPPSEYSVHSIASHVRGVQIPSKHSDVDQFLDELFEPVLKDSQFEEYYDARSIAASIRGTEGVTGAQPGMQGNPEGFTLKNQELFPGTQQQQPLVPPVIMMVPMHPEALKFAGVALSSMMPQMVAPSFTATNSEDQFQRQFQMIANSLQTSSGSSVSSFAPQPVPGMHFVPVPMQMPNMYNATSAYPNSQTASLMSAQTSTYLHSSPTETASNSSSDTPPEPKFPLEQGQNFERSQINGGEALIRVSTTKEQKRQLPIIPDDSDLSPSTNEDLYDLSPPKRQGSVKLIGQLKPTPLSARYATSGAPGDERAKAYERYENCSQIIEPNYQPHQSWASGKFPDGLGKMPQGSGSISQRSGDISQGLGGSNLLRQRSEEDDEWISAEPENQFRPAQISFQAAVNNWNKPVNSGFDQNGGRTVTVFAGATNAGAMSVEQHRQKQALNMIQAKANELPPPLSSYATVQRTLQKANSGIIMGRDNIIDDVDYKHQNKPSMAPTGNGSEARRHPGTLVEPSHLPTASYSQSSFEEAQEKVYPKRTQTQIQGSEPEPEGDWFREDEGEEPYHGRGGMTSTLLRRHGEDGSVGELRRSVGEIRQMTPREAKDMNSLINDMGKLYSDEQSDPNVVTTEQQLNLDSEMNSLSQTSANTVKRKRPFLTYKDAPWEVSIRKELFLPGETLDDSATVDLVFSQILTDVSVGNPYRIRRDERRMVLAELDEFSVSPGRFDADKIPMFQKQNVISLARQWPLYFSRLYPVTAVRNAACGVTVLGLHESGIRLGEHSKEYSDEPLRIVDYLGFADLNLVEVVEPGNIIVLQTVSGSIIRLFADHAEEIKEAIEEYIYGQKPTKSYARALTDYLTKEPHLLSFRKGDIIELEKRIATEESLGRGWLHGRIQNNYGHFPREYVKLLTEDDEVLDDQGSVDLQFDKEMMGDDPKKEKLTMMEFAMQYFRQPHPHKFELLKTHNGNLKGTMTSSDRKSRKEWTWRELAELVKFSKSPIQNSLLTMENPDFNRLAVESFLYIMQCMGDHSLKKHQSCADCIYSILTICHQHPPMRDEVYSQIVKQTTNNRGKPDSCIRGWRLFSILTAYFDCSEVLKPYLFKYLSDASNDTRRAYHGTAAVCLQNLKKTFKYGGRKYLLSPKEIDAVMAGKNLKRQIYHLPGGSKRVINTKSVTTTDEIISELCVGLNVLSPAEQQEFCLCYVVEQQNVMKLLSNDDYILDVTTELEQQNQQYFLLLKRTVWLHPLRVDNDLYIDVMFFQVVPDYLEGLLVIMRSPDSLSASTMDDIALLAALLHKADDAAEVDLINERNVQQLLPKIVQNVRSVGCDQWAERVNAKLSQLNRISRNVARAKFLEVLQSWPLFGSTFFYVLDVSDARIQGDCLLAINRHGVQFLDIITHETLVEFQLYDVYSAHKITAAHPITGQPMQFLDLIIGNLLQQQTLHLETDQGPEISRLLGQYITTQSRSFQTTSAFHCNEENRPH